MGLFHLLHNQPLAIPLQPLTAMCLNYKPLTHMSSINHPFENSRAPQYPGNKSYITMSIQGHGYSDPNGLLKGHTSIDFNTGLLSSYLVHQRYSWPGPWTITSFRVTFIPTAIKMKIKRTFKSSEQFYSVTTYLLNL